MRGRFRLAVIVLVDAAMAERPGEKPAVDITMAKSVRAFDKEGMKHVVDQAIEKVGCDRTAYLEGRVTGDVRTAVRAAVLNVIREYCSTAEEFESERAYLLSPAPVPLE